ncbi:MAG: hypothetical protein H0X62_03610 [Bacteroidetes bacterium]|nr:hypothetical protein [Bacteroidota bacterium]
MSKKIIFYGICLFFLLSALGYARDFTFVNINAALSDLWYQTNYHTFPNTLSFLETFSYNQLYQLKWLLTVVVSLLFLLIYILGIYLIFKKKKYIVWSLACFAFIYLISGIFYMYGYFFNDLARGYKFSRIFMGFIQSPLLLMLLIPAFILGKEVE